MFGEQEHEKNELQTEPQASEDMLGCSPFGSPFESKEPAAHVLVTRTPPPLLFVTL